VPRRRSRARWPLLRGEADVPQRNKALAQINYQIQDYAKAVEYGNKYLVAAPGSADIGALVAQSKFLQDDFAGARATVDQITTGQAKPDEQLLLIGLRSNYELKDRPGTVRSSRRSSVTTQPPSTGKTC